ncbi:hypothetical protein CQW23_23272 [Capsicum baccatum]|uniref:non-specific serine/threonine protein kinase n=1 Tax=Capsicum baccatum TaxID=33114 RepID=A0A2G2VRH8_CAPBA|nr:hypothetical protein CQW23_23272 [Capsicum baccatum]
MNFISLSRPHKIIDLQKKEKPVCNMGISCNLFFAFVVFILLHRYAILAIGPNISTDEAALLALKSHISPYRNNILASNWSSSSSVCSWIGITCSSRHRRVTSLDISNMQLHGTIPPHVGNLSFLVSLDIRNNTFHGELPKELAHLRRLKMIDCSRNNFTRVIPSFLSLLPNLRFLQLSRNQFFGGIPSSLSNLTKLEELKMSKNFLQGEIPQEFGHFRYMTILDLQFNRLTGSIPPSIFNIKTMQIIALTGNNLTGKLPETICDHLPNLEGLHIANNNLHGSIPPKVEKCRKLEVLALSINEFTGTVPRELGNITGLAAIYLGYLHLKGEIPVELGNLMKLETIELDSNEFTGSINNFHSDLTMSFLTSLTNCRKLRVVSFSANPIDGFFSSPVGNFSDSLQIFEGGACNLNGIIPKEIGNLTGVTRMNLVDNALTGCIPDTIHGMLNVQELYLDNNKIEGTIPDVICNLKNLGALNLSGNQFSGSVPRCLGNVTSLRKIHLANNRLNSTLPASLGSIRDLIEFDVSSNLLSGKIPLEIGNFKAATLIDLSKNKVSGNIPSTIGDLDKLTSLSLARNRLYGPIPDSFGKMLSLEFLDLSYNNLSGEIPKSLEALVYLKHLNFAFNKLTGEIPTGGPFANANDQSFLYNDALCGDPKFYVSPCVIKSPKRKKTILVPYILLGVGLLFLALALAYIRMRKIKKNVGQADVCPVKGHERISYYELEQATEGFSESKLLGSGSFSKVYKGILTDGTLVAAKVFNVELEGAFKSFDTECEVLRNLRHRNLTKVITSCSNPDFKAVILDYMTNGTLEKWLYSHNFFLDIMQRLDTMIDVASAMVYLHNGYTTTVVHCDLKPSNVLLDQEMVGHVSDFGIAKLLGAEETFVQTRTIATIGYIAPEYGQDGIVSTRCDVYSFGILMMETFTRMKPSDELFSGDLSLRSWVADFFPSGIHQVVDANLVQPGDERTDRKMQCLLSIMKLALSCTVVTPDARISMEDALSTLKKTRLQFVSNRR